MTTDDEQRQKALDQFHEFNDGKGRPIFDDRQIPSWVIAACSGCGVTRHHRFSDDGNDLECLECGCSFTQSKRLET